MKKAICRVVASVKRVKKAAKPIPQLKVDGDLHCCTVALAAVAGWAGTKEAVLAKIKPIGERAIAAIQPHGGYNQKGAAAAFRAHTKEGAKPQTKLAHTFPGGVEIWIINP